MADDIAIKVENVSKTFKLPHEKNNSIKGAVVNFYKRNKSYEKQQVLNDISFEIKKGEFFGIIGRNGSGKSTLLKILSGIYAPSGGSVKINGKLTPFIELGVGFNPELTGRENVFLNGALLGFSRKEMHAMYEDIVEFAELEKFMDQKLKNYSSGMQVRLAFSIAIRAESDVLILDEVLAVGDENFQKKCLKVFSDLKSSNKTIILVSHSVGDIERFCDRVLVVDKSESLGIFKAREATAIYQELNFYPNANNSSTSSHNRWGTVGFKIRQIQTSQKGLLRSGQDLTVTLTVVPRKKLSKPQQIVAGLAFYDESGINLSGPNSRTENLIFPAHKDQVDITYTVPDFPFVKGVYKITAGVFDEDLVTTYDYWVDAINIQVASGEDSGGKIRLSGSWRLK